MKWGLVCNFHSKKACLLAEDLKNFLKKDHEVFLENHLSKKGYTLDEINKKADIIITIGGDGTQEAWVFLPSLSLTRQNLI
jgi:NAD kinase